MTDTIRVRVVGSQFRYDREQYERGDEIEVAEQTLAKHPRTLAPVADDDQADEADDDAPNGGDGSEAADEPYVVDPHPSDLTVADLRERIEDVDDVGLLEAIRDVEADGKDRETALAAIDARIDDLEG